MNTEELVYEKLTKMHEKMNHGHTTRHSKLSAEILSEVYGYLSAKGIKVEMDEYWPYHIKVGDYSVYAGGWREDMVEIQKVVDGNYEGEELGFSIEEAVDYLEKKIKEVV